MGHGSYSAADWGKLRTSRNMDSTVSETEIFKKNQMDPRFDPRFINMREARDSEDHPNSTPIIIGLDVTGSMGFLSNKIAREALHETMMKLYSTKPVEDPQLMFAAYGDYRDAAPLQVTQFESDIRIAEQLLDLWLENGGNGMVVPSFLWHFAANHTDIDSFKKRKKKGFLFTIGDEAECRVNSLGPFFERAFGEHVSGDVKRILKDAQKQYEVFHIFIDGEAKGFKELLPGRTMCISRDEIDLIPEIIISAMQVANGEKPADVCEQWSELARPTVLRVTTNLTVGNSKKGFFF